MQMATEAQRKYLRTMLNHEVVGALARDRDDLTQHVGDVEWVEVKMPCGITQRWGISQIPDESRRCACGRPHCWAIRYYGQN